MLPGKVEEVTSLTTGMQRLRQEFDLAELTTAVFVASMCLIGKDVLPRLFAQARDIVLSGIAFEFFGTLVLALFADHAMLSEQRMRRIVWLTIGAVLAFVCCALGALIMLTPGLMLGSIWLLMGRLQCPAGLVPYSREHCYVIHCVSGAAWCVFLLALVLTVLLTLAAGTKASETSAPWVYAITWGGFYFALAMVLPAVRRRATQSPSPV